MHLVRLDRALAALTLVLTAGPALHAQRPGQLPDVATLTRDPAIPTELAGRTLAQFPFFEFTRSFNEGDSVWVGLDLTTFGGLVGQTVDVYVVEHKSPGAWVVDPVLVPAGQSSVVPITIAAGGIQVNSAVVDAGTLSADAGLGLGVPYAMVVDVDQDGLLDPTDYIDGLGSPAGLYVVHDLTQPGPLAVTEITYSGGTFLGQNTFYPTNIASMGRLPLVVVSHGNGHSYVWYDHIGNHLASYGYVVMSHQNNTVPGVVSASVTTRTNTNYFLANLSTIGGGVLDGHVDSSRMTWLGHSRGGEGVVIAYHELFVGNDSYPTYTYRDVKLVSSMAPVDFQGPAQTLPHEVDYHLWTAGADADVNGCADCNLCQTFHLHDRAERTRVSISLNGVGHGDLHNGGGSSVATGPCLVGRPTTHQIQLAYLLALVKFFIDDEPAAEDYLWRQYEVFHPVGAPIGNPCVVANLMYRRDPAEAYVIDDFQTQASTALASSGASVSFTVQNLTEGRFDDANTVFTDNALDPMNGMTLGGDTSTQPADTTAGIVFEYDGLGDYELVFELAPGAPSFAAWDYLSFRACQATRDLFTTAALADLVFEVELVDGSANTSAIATDAYGGGIEEPYQRSSCGIGTGWGNEFETIRLRLADFARDGAALDLTDVRRVVFRFGPSHGSAQGRVGLDDVQLER